MKLIHALEPVFWMLFGAGAMGIVFLGLPMFLGVLVLGPAGVFSSGLGYDRAHALAFSPIGKLLFCVLIPLVFWHCAHHLRHFALDIGGHSVAAPAAIASYSLALLGTIATLAIVLPA